VTSLAMSVWQDAGLDAHASVLLVAHDPRIGHTVASGLREHGFAVTTTIDVIDLEAVARLQPDVIVIEALLAPSRPDPDCWRLVGIPVVVIGHNRLDDVVSALDNGATEYIVAPQRERELVARLRSVLRRRPALRRAVVTAGDVTVDLIAGRATLRHQPLALAREDAALLGVLVERAGRVVPRRELLRAVWGRDLPTGRRTITEQVRRLRAHLERDPAQPVRLLTVRGVGYRYVPYPAIDLTGEGRDGSGPWLAPTSTGRPSPTTTTIRPLTTI
jgi:two-component system response regulator RegX3